MHEVSIAQALLELVRDRVPAGTRLTEVHVEAGPLQQLDGGSLEMAWRAVAAGTALEDAKIVLTELPWALTCQDCQRSWEGTDPLAKCQCGSEAVSPEGSAGLRVTALEVEAEEEMNGGVNAECEMRNVEGEGER